jgi:hypothetical protein
VSIAPSRLRSLAQRPAAPEPEISAEEQCELCSEPIDAGHRHLLDVQLRRMLCVCRPCSILFDQRGAGGAHYRLIPRESRRLVDFDLDDAVWQSFRIPVDLAFFFDSSAAGKVVAFYPAPVGATESLLELGDWEAVVAKNPVLAELEQDVEALLVHRTRGARDHWLVPVDRCYELVGLIRKGWKGFGGGPDVWAEVDRFFERLRREATPVTREGATVRNDA